MVKKTSIIRKTSISIIRAVGLIVWFRPHYLLISIGKFKYLMHFCFINFIIKYYIGLLTSINVLTIMANTYTQLNIHGIFSVLGRENILTGNFRYELFKYISGILKNIKQYPLAVNGYKDHVHVFFELHPTASVSEVMQIVKSNSSNWINENKFIPGKFRWQSGYGAFSYSRAQRDNVINYIIEQEKHHSTRSFKDEYLELLRRFEIDYNDVYLFDFYDNI